MNQLIHKEQSLAVAQFDQRCLLLDISSCSLPSNLSQLFASPPWADKDLQQSKTLLNDVKNRLDKLPNKEWEWAATQANRAENVKHALRREFQAELCTIAWAKMYECIVFCNLLPEDSLALGQASDGNPYSLTCHLCEAPGAFISATNHYIRTHRPSWWWDWVAISLNPHFEGNDQFQMIDDDKLINETMPNWCWGEDSSGDLRWLPNMVRLWDEARGRAVGSEGESLCPGAMLVTADGAVDTSMDPNRQEEICAGLHLCEIVAAIGLLAPGGHFMWKAFTLFEHASIASLYLMGCLFDGVAVYKPATSKPANSEVYIVGRGFKGIDPEVMEVLKSKVSADDIFGSRSIFDKAHIEGSGGFFASAKKAAIAFSQWQQEAIIEALDRHAGKSQALSNAMKETQAWFGSYWIKELRVMHLDRSLFLAPHAELDGRNNNSSEAAGKKRKLEGTLEERQEQFKKRSKAIAGPASRAWAANIGSGGLLTLQAPVRHEEGEGGGMGLGGSLSVKADDGSKEPDGGGLLVPAEIPGMNPLAKKMMEKMGFKTGQGLGSEGRQGAAQAVEVKGNKARAGLGAGNMTAKESKSAGGGVEGVEWSLQPSTKWLTNDRPLDDCWSPSLGSIPSRITKSKTIPDDDILSELIDITYKAYEHESSGDAAVIDGESLIKRRLCSHRSPLDDPSSQGCCLAPRRGTRVDDRDPSDLERSWFKLGALDVSLSIIAEARLLMYPPKPGYEQRNGVWAGPPNLFLLDLGTKSILSGLKEVSKGLSVKEEPKDGGESGEGSKNEEQKGPRAVQVQGRGARDYILSAVTDTLDLPRNSTMSQDGSHESEVMDAWRERTLVIPAALWSKVTGDKGDDAHSLHFFYSIETVAEIVDLLGGGLARSWTSTAALVVGDLSSLHTLIPPPHTDQGRGVRPLEFEHNALYRKQLLFESLTGLLCLVPGGSMVLRLSHTLTSFSITLIYALFRSFEKMWIGKPFSSCSSSSERFLVLCQRIEDGGAAASLIARALALESESQVVKGSQLDPDSQALADILPLSQALKDKTFYSYLASATSILAERQTRSMKQLLSETKSSNSDPHERADGRLSRKGDQRVRSIKAITEDRGDLIVDPSLSFFPAPRWAIQVKPEAWEVQQVPAAPPPPAPAPLASQPSTSNAPAPRPPPSSVLPQPSSELKLEPGVFPLYTRHQTKGKELVCHLLIDPWPLDEIMGMRELVVHEFVPRSAIERQIAERLSSIKSAMGVAFQTQTPLIMPYGVAKAKAMGSIRGLQGFVEYLFGAIKAKSEEQEAAGGATSMTRKEKVAVVKWGSLTFYLTLRVSDNPNPNYGLLLFV